MSKYTTELRFICEQAAGLTESSDDAYTVIQAARSKIFSFAYPIYDESHRADLETKILAHYYTREIGFETAGLWKMKLAVKMNEIMPYYNELYAMLDRDFDPLGDVDYTVKKDGQFDTKRDTTNVKNYSETTQSRDDETRNEKTVAHETTDSTSTGESEGINRRSDTPQGGLQGVLDDTYLTTATVDTTNATSNDQYERDLDEDHSTTNTINRNGTRGGNDTVNDNMLGTDVTDELTRTKGKVNSGKSYAELINEWKEARLNVDMLIIGELNTLFMGLW